MLRSRHILGAKTLSLALENGLLTTGHQLRAARALAAMDQADLAKRARVNVNTIRNMERAGAGPIAGRAANVQAVQAALEAAGIEFLDGDRPGVRLKQKSRRRTNPRGPN